MVRYNFQYRYRKCIILTLLYCIGWIDGAAGCDHDHRHHLDGEDHHRHLDEGEEAAAEIEPCGFEEPSPIERLQDQINMFLWKFDRDTDPDAPPINYTIPVYFHILQQNSTALLVDDSNIALYMNYLSIAFTTSGAPFRFILMGITRTINATISNSCHTYQNDIKPKLKRGGKETLNVYVCNRINDKAWVGYASLPSNNLGTNDGVTISRTTPTDLNRPNTLVHEVGHYLGLHHTFVDNCTTTRGGDLVDDTPYHVSLSSAVNCRTPVSTWDTCPTLPGLDPVDNYMTYTVANHECRTKFTPGQVERMKAQFEIYRYVAPPIATRAPTATPTAVPTAVPTATPTAAPTAALTAAPTAAPAAVLTPAPTVTPTTQLTQAPFQSTTGNPTTSPIHFSTPTAAAPILPTKAPVTTTSPATNSPLTLTPSTATPVVPAPAPTTAPIPSSPPRSSNSPLTAVPVPVPVIFTAAPIAPKCKFYFSLCDSNDQCCGGVCRMFLGLFPKRCSIFINSNV